jgi:hypothetical protein
MGPWHFSKQVQLSNVALIPTPAHCALGPESLELKEG